MKIKNQVAIVTGGTKGIGGAITRMLLEEGAKVIALYWGDEENTLEFKESLNKTYGENLICCKGDASKYVDLERIFQINLFSQVYGTEIFAKQYDKKNQAGKIINISSILGVNPFACIGGTRSPEYCTSKAASIMYTKVAACNFNGKILVNSISPGNTTTPPWENASKEFKKTRAEEALIGRFLKVEEISHTAKYIIENDAINGEDIVVDGGSIVGGKK